MVGETKAFFREVLHGGFTLREFLNSDWTMVNSRLAQFYGLPETGLPRDDFQRVSLPAESHRGGLLTQASILSLTSDGTRHRPVHRGKWVSESIFGRSPPPPPANVDPIAPNPVDAPKATLRMKLEAHIHDARCASCHSRSIRSVWRLKTSTPSAAGAPRKWSKEPARIRRSIPPVPSPTDANTQRPKNSSKLLLADLDAFNHAFIEKLATYGLRRSMSFDDRDDLEDDRRCKQSKGLPPARHRRSVRSFRPVPKTLIHPNPPPRP